LIAQLKAENFEYRQKEKDYNILHSQLLDLEHRFRLLQEEKTRAEREAHDREDQGYRSNESIQNEIKIVKTSIEDKQKQLKDLSAELAALKELAGDKTEEISHLKQQIANSVVTTEELSKDKKELENEINFENDKRRAAQIEAEKLSNYNDQIAKEKGLAEDNIAENQLEIKRLNDRISLVNSQISDTDAIIKQRNTELGLTLDTKSNLQHEIDDIIVSNGRLKDENNVNSLKIRDLENELDRLNKRFDEIVAITDVRDKELKAAKSTLSYTEDKSTSVLDQVKQVSRENEVLQSLLDKYRNDVELQKQLRDQEIAKKLEIEAEKKRLEREVLHKDLEARSAKKELEKVQEDKANLLDNHLQLNQELNALKEHTELLHSQNKTLNRELDSFVDTDQKVREDLDRKYRVDYLKAKNNEELQKSVTKLRESQSPAKKSPYKSPYKSPFRNPPA